MTFAHTLKNSVVLLSISILFLGSCKQQVNETKPVSDPEIDYAAKVYPLLDTENSRWFYFSSASRPFGMVNLSPDTQIGGAWGSGYRYKTDTIKGFSHIHAWQMSGISVMPVTTNEKTKDDIFKDFYSKFNHDNEVVTPGYHKVELERYAIEAQLSSTKRVGFHQYTYPDNEEEKAILFNLNTLLGPSSNIDGVLDQNSDNELSGKVTMEPTHRRPKPMTVFFKIQLNTQISSIENVGTKPI